MPPIPPFLSQNPIFLIPIMLTYLLFIVHNNSVSPLALKTLPYLLVNVRKYENQIQKFGTKFHHLQKLDNFDLSTVT